MGIHAFPFRLLYCRRESRRWPASPMQIRGWQGQALPWRLGSGWSAA